MIFENFFEQTFVTRFCSAFEYLPSWNNLYV